MKCNTERQPNASTPQMSGDKNPQTGHVDRMNSSIMITETNDMVGMTRGHTISHAAQSLIPLQYLK
jgi:hypothetical protein